MKKTGVDGVVIGKLGGWVKARLSAVAGLTVVLFAGTLQAAVTVNGGSQFTFVGNNPATLVPNGSAVSSNPVDIALSSKGMVPFAISQFGGAHTIAHLNDGIYGNSYSWISKSLNDARSIDLGGAYGTVTMSFAGVALTNTYPVTGFCFGRDAANAYNDRIAGTMYVQITTVPDLHADLYTCTNSAADGSWATVGSFTTTDGRDHEFAFNTPTNITGLRIVTAGGNCIDEIAIYTTSQASTGQVVVAALQWDADPNTAGIQDGSGQWDLSSLNWLNSSNNVAWIQGSDALIGDTGSVSNTLTLSTNVTANSIIVKSTQTFPYTLVSDGTARMLSSPSLLSTSVNARTTIGDVNAPDRLTVCLTGTSSNGLGSTASGGATYLYARITNSAAATGTPLQFNALAVGSTFLLNSNNTFDCPVYVCGTVSFNSIKNVGGGASALGAPTTVTNGTINNIGTDATCAIALIYTGTGDTSDRAFNLRVYNFSPSIQNSGTGPLILTGPITLNVGYAWVTGNWVGRTFQFKANTADLTLGGLISNGTFRNAAVYTGGGLARTITVTNNNTYTGPSLVYGVTLSVPSIKMAGQAGPLGKPAPGNFDAGIRLGYTTQDGRLLYTGAGETTDRFIDLLGSTGGGTIQNDGTGALIISSNVTATGVGSKTLTLAGSCMATSEVRYAIANNSALNKTSLTKAGPGAWTVSGVNTYTGPTTINEGVLLVNGSLAVSGMVTVVNGTLGGTGSLLCPVQVQAGGTLDPDPAGTFSINTLTILANGSLTCRANATANNKLVVTGSLVLPPAMTVNVSVEGGDLKRSIVLIDYSAGTNLGATDLSGWTVTGDGSWVCKNDVLRKRVVLVPARGGPVFFVK